MNLNVPEATQNPGRLKVPPFYFSKQGKLSINVNCNKGLLDMNELESERPHHKKAIRELTNQLRPVFEGSSEGVFLYLDGEHKTCSDRLSDMFGYTPLQWEEIYPFEKIFSEDSKDEVMSTYYEKIIAEKAPAEVNFTGVRKDGSSFKARMLMVPVTYDNILFALSFVKLV